MENPTQTRGLVDYITLMFKPTTMCYRAPAEEIYHILYVTTFTQAEQGYERQLEGSGLIEIINSYSELDGVYFKKVMFPPCAGVLETIAFPIGRTCPRLRELFSNVLEGIYDFVANFPGKSKDVV